MSKTNPGWTYPRTPQQRAKRKKKAMAQEQNKREAEEKAKNYGNEVNAQVERILWLFADAFAEDRNKNAEDVTLRLDVNGSNVPEAVSRAVSRIVKDYPTQAVINDDGSFRMSRHPRP